MSPKLRWMWGAVFGWLVLDQGSKWLTRATLRERVDEVMLIPGWFGFTHATNKGAAFSSMADSPHRIPIFLAFTAVAVAVIMLASRLLHEGDRWPAAALGTLLGGALGNAIDRAVFGQVTDMIKVAAGSGPLHDWAITRFHTDVWPIFNVADSAIWVGVLGFPLAWAFVRDAPSRANDEPLANEPRESAPTLE
jgi:signal peptidase II